MSTLKAYAIKAKECMLVTIEWLNNGSMNNLFAVALFNGDNREYEDLTDGL